MGVRFGPANEFPGLRRGPADFVGLPLSDPLGAKPPLVELVQKVAVHLRLYVLDPVWRERRSPFVVVRLDAPQVDVQASVHGVRAGEHSLELLGCELGVREVGSDVEADGGQGDVATGTVALGANHGVRDEQAKRTGGTERSLEDEQAVLEELPGAAFARRGV